MAEEKEGEPQKDATPSLQYDARRFALAIGMVSLAVILLVAFYHVASLLLLLFAGLLFGIFLQGIARFVQHRLPWEFPYRAVFPITSLLALGVTVGGVWLFAPAIVEQGREFAQILPDSLEELRQIIETWPAGETLASYIPEDFERLGAMFSELGKYAPRLAKFFSMSFGTVGDFFIIIFVGVFLAWEPELYRRGLVRLVPPDYRERGDHVIRELVTSLRNWILGRILSMVIVGVAIGVGLWFLDVPLPLTLGVLAAVLSIVPNFGPLLSFIPAFLIGWMTGGPTLAFYVWLLFGVVQGSESYFITPVIQEHAASVPPALLLSAQILLGFTAGALGLVIATPMLVAVIVLTRTIYVEEILESDDEPAGSDREDQSDGEPSGPSSEREGEAEDGVGSEEEGDREGERENGAPTVSA